MNDTPALSVMAGHRAGHPSGHLPLPMAGTLPGHDRKEARTSQAFCRLVLFADAEACEQGVEDVL